MQTTAYTPSNILELSVASDVLSFWCMFFNNGNYNILEYLLLQMA
jgi:hypothetical protein